MPRLQLTLRAYNVFELHKVAGTLIGQSRQQANLARRRYQNIKEKS